MAILERERNKLDITLGRDDDCCLYCIKELLSVPDILPENNNEIYAQEKLKGRLSGKPIYKNRRRNLVICMEHLKQMVKQGDGESEE